MRPNSESEHLDESRKKAIVSLLAKVEGLREEVEHLNRKLSESQLAIANAGKIIRALYQCLDDGCPDASTAGGGMFSLFDGEFYVSNCPDFAGSELPPLEHYVNVGWKQGLDPSPFFSTRWYLEDNPDVKAEGICPLLHYVNHGYAENRKVRASERQPEHRAHLDRAALNRRIAELSGITVNPEFYRMRYPDVADPSLDPVAHYFEYGAGEGLLPAPLLPQP